MEDKRTYEELAQKVRELSKELESSKHEITALKGSENYYRAFFEHGMDGVVVLDPNTAQPINFNDQACRQLGYSREEFARLRLSDIELKETAAETQAHIQKIVKNGFDNFETLQRTKQGEIKHVQVLAQVIDIDGRQVYHCIWRDITEHKKAEEALHLSEEKLRATLDATPFPIAIVDLQDDRIIYWSRSAFTLFGHAAPTASEWYQIAYPDPGYRQDVIERWKPFLGKARESRQPVNTGEYRVTCKDGSERICELYATVLPDNLIVTFNDITERKQAENALKEEQAFLGALIDAIPVPVFYKNRAGQYLGFNKAFESFFGKTKEHLIGKSVFDINPKDLAEIYYAKDKELFEKDGKQQYESQVKNANGELRNVIFNKSVYYNNQGSVVGLIGAILDITDRKRSEEALKKSEVRYRSMMESITDPLYICSPDFIVEYLNPAMISRLGRNATGERCHNALHGLDHRCDWCVFNKVAKGESIETTIIGPLDGRTYRVTNMPVQNQNGTVSKMSIFRDITGYLKAVAEKEKLEQELRQAQKMESIGTLAGGIAHDFNNILYPIIGFAELSLEDLPENHPVKENLEDILQGAKRARDLVKQILAFSSQREEEQKPLVLSPLIQEALKLLRSTIPSNIDIQQELYDTQDCVLVSPIEIHEIVMNLCTNAYHAMEETGGTLRVCLYKSEPDPKLNLSHGDYCCLSIHDTGIGISTEIINNIFDPYFTTKEQGKGSGLGLSVVHGIIKKAHGAISVESIPGKGTVFKIYLPITSAINKPDETSEDKPNLGGNEKILFVDDEVAIVKLGVRLLEKLGYTVTGKNSSIEALALFKSAPDAFNLVITDMTMPQMVGTEFATKLMETRPDIPIIICTGFSERVDIETAASLGIREYIHKPILSVDLYSKVRAVLDQSKKG
ncbi:MAG: PAS domain S-box protein [Desulfobacula sp.]|nr:PAS domain S-box protein [Desulfobacula sp.]MBU3915086.1 PAS domain S-box protein [bacterium]